MTATTNNTVTKTEESLKIKDYVLFVVMAIVLLSSFSVILDNLTTYLLVDAFGYTNFDLRFKDSALLAAVLFMAGAIIALPIVFLYRLFILFGMGVIILLLIAVTLFFVKSNGLTTEQYAYQESLKQFENQYLLSDDENLVVSQHPDMIDFYFYKDNDLLSESVRRDYFNKISTNATQLNYLSRYTTVYNLGFFGKYFLSKQDSDKFFMAYSDVKDISLKSELVRMIKNPLVKTLDYAEFHASYRKKFIENNAAIIKVNSFTPSTIESKNMKMIDAQSISSIIHFFENNKESALMPIKTEFLSLLSQPSISIADVEQFMNNLTNVLKSDTNLYYLMSQL